MREGEAKILIRPARAADIASIVAMFASDGIGGHGDTLDPAARAGYERAFAAIGASPNDTLYVAECDGQVVGTFQTTVTVTMTGRGGTVFTVEAVHTRTDMRGRGIGAAMMAFAIERARDSRARLVQLMSNAGRTDAHRFYERLGFAKSHVGFKMKL